MFLGPAGDTLFYKRRVDGLDALYVFQPDTGRIEVHAQIASSKEQLRAWPTLGGYVIVCTGWPRTPVGLRFRFFDSRRISELLDRQASNLNSLLTDVPVLGDFKLERSALPVDLFEAVKGERVVLPGFFPSPSEPDAQVPALYEIDGTTASYRVVPLRFLKQSTLPGALVDEPGGARRWLTVGDSNHLFVLDGQSHELVGDVIWPAEQQALARVTHHPVRNETWISALSSVFVYDRSSLELIAEIPIEEELRWHRGARVLGFIGAVVFSQDGGRALVARPLSGDLLEVDVVSRKRIGRVPCVIDPLELCTAPGVGRVFMQSLRNGNISWFPYR
ncbi:MAG: hypothetical protein KDB32_01495 [Planctomycetes bacterium]|nr:hypothetical protein [Planctomycetota bacterium]